MQQSLDISDKPNKKMDLEGNNLKSELSLNDSEDSTKRNLSCSDHAVVPKVKVVYGDKRLVDCMKNIIQNGYLL